MASGLKGNVYMTTRAGQYAAPIAFADGIEGLGGRVIKRGRKWVYFKLGDIGEADRLCGLGLAIPIDMLFPGLSASIAEAMQTA